MEKARERLLSQLVEYRRVSDHNITVVFDGYKYGTATGNISYYGGVRVIFTKLGERADDVIKKMISSERRGWIVVSADRDIVEHAWAVGAAPIPPESFMSAIDRRIRERAIERASDEDDEPQESLSSRKGNPHQLSRKEKLLRQAIRKL